MPRTVVALGLVLLASVPVGANFHFAEIHEVMSGCGADATVQFVEIRMTSSGQNVVGDSTLTAFSCDGSVPSRTLLVVPTDIANAMSGARWIMASPSFQAAAGIAPDFVMTGADPGIFPDCGQICWGKPGVVPIVDCVAYGPYTGPPAPLGTPVTSTPNTGSQSLTRAGSGANNFALAPPSPTNSMGELGNLSACTPVTSTTTT